MDDNRSKLLKRIKKYLSGGSGDPEMDQLELIEVSDYAGDAEDFHVREQILEYAISRYSDYEPLLIRYALLQLEGGNRAKADDYASRVSDTITLKRIYKCITAIDDYLPDEEVIGMAQSILDDVRKFSDEDVIRYVNMVADINGGYSWLKGHMETIRAKTSYMPTLLYEMAQISRDEGEIGDAIEYIEALTEVDPFDPEYWELLAEMHIDNDDLENAVNSLQYALAINPSSPRARILNARIELTRQTRDPEDIASAIEDLVFSDDQDVVPLYLVFSALMVAGKTEKALEYVNWYLDKYPTARRAIDFLFMGNADDSATTRRIVAYYEAIKDTEWVKESYWQQWAEDLYVHNEFNGAALVLSIYATQRTLTDNTLLIKALYLSNRAANAVELILGSDWLTTRSDGNGILRTANPSLNDFSRPSMAIILIMGLIRTNHENAAMSIIEAELKGIHDNMVPGNIELNIMVTGYKETLKAIKKGLKNNTYPDEYDPLLLPGNLKK